MADTIRKVSYYYTSVSNKPGEGARLLQVLRQAGVNLLALHAFPSARKAQVDFVPSDGMALTAAAQAANINVTAVTGVCAGMGRYGAILWVKPGDVNKAATTLGAM